MALEGPLVNHEDMSHIVCVWVGGGQSIEPAVLGALFLKVFCAVRTLF